MKIKILIIALLLALPIQAYAWPGKQVKIRFYGIDTPDKKKPVGKAAKSFTANLVSGKVVDVEEVTTDRYGRTIALVRVNGKNVNKELVRSGYAWVYRQYCKKDFCSDWLKPEESTRNKKAGLWNKKATDPLGVEKSTA